MMDGREEIVFVDETTFNLWQAPCRAWLRKDMTLTLPDSRGRSVTVIGALSEKRGLVHWSILGRTNNADTFARFLVGLKDKSRGRMLVVMDNLATHRAKAVTEVSRAGFRQLFLAPYSRRLNPIERVWSVAKQEWRRTQHLRAQAAPRDKDESQREAIEVIQRILGK